jgi:hypothetical protein
LKDTNKKLENYSPVKKGLQKRKQRTADVEPVFAQLKHHHNFRRFSLRGIQKAELEFG